MSGKARVLFVCVANAARSQIAEALLRHMAADQYEAFSAGSAPTGIDPRTIEALHDKGISVEGLRSKSLDEFEGQAFDYVITLCDKSALECRALPNAGEVIAWDFEDPASSRRDQAFKSTLHAISERIKMFVLVKSKR